MKQFNVDVESRDSLLETLWNEAECQNTQIEIVLIPAKNQLLVKDGEDELAQINLIKVVDEFDVTRDLFD